MTTQYTSILKLALPVQGELSGTWGDTVNDNITSMVEEAIAGRSVINSWTANSHTLTTADGTTSESRAAMLEFTDTGAALSGNATVICPTASKIYIAKNAVGSSRTVTLKTSAGTGIAIPDGTTMFLFCDGTNVVEAVTNINSFNVGGTVAINAIKDEDDMSSDSATALATQQSIKAYVDSQVGSFDTLAEVLAQGNTTGGTDIAVGTGDDITFADSSKAIFGAGSDLQIYHNGSHSLIEDSGQGDLKLRGANLKLQDPDGNDFISMTDTGTGGTVELKNTGTTRLSTTSTGIDVTGTATADGVEVDGLLHIDGSDNANVAVFALTRTDASWSINNETNFRIYGDTSDTTSPSTKRFEIATGGDISFYEDTGTTAKLFWDASAESLGIGSTDPAADALGSADDLVIKNASSAGLTIKSADSGNQTIALGASSDEDYAIIQGYYNSGSPFVRTSISGVEKTRVNGSGFDVTGTVTVSSATPTLQFTDTDNNYDATIQGLSGSLVLTADSGAEFGTESIQFKTGATERVRIDASGNVGIGTTSPSTALTVSGAFNATSAGSKPSITGTGNYGGGIGFIDTNVSGMYTDTSGANLKFFTNQSSSDAAQDKVAMTIDGSGNVTITSTDAGAGAGPLLDLHRNSSSPADNDYLGEIRFRGENSASEVINYAGLATRIIDVTDGTEDGRFELYTSLNGAQISRVLADSSTTIINQDSADLDFRIESDSNANAFFVDAGNDRVSIDAEFIADTDSGNQKFYITRTGNSSEAGGLSTDDQYFILDSIQDEATVSYGAFLFRSTNATNSNVQLAIFDQTEVRFNEDSKDQDFRVESNNNSGMLFVDAANDVVSIGYQGTAQMAGERHELEVFDTNFSVISGATFRNGSDGATVTLGHSRSGTIGTQTVLQDGDMFGGINFVGSDGTDFANVGAYIRANVDGTPGTDDMPGRLVFATSADGSNSPTERMRISQDGKIRLGNSGDHVMIDVTASNAALQLIDNNQSNPPTIRGNGPNFTIENGGLEMMRVSGTTETVFNEASQNIDFRVESDSNANMLFVDAGNDRVSVGSSGSDAAVSSYALSATGSVPFVAASNSTASTETYGAVGIYRTKGTNSEGTGISFQLNDDAGNVTEYSYIGTSIKDAANGSEDGAFLIMNTVAASTRQESARFGRDETVFNEGSRDLDFRVESNNNANMLFLDAGNDIVVVGGGSPYTAGRLEVFATSDTSSNGISINGTSSATSFRLYTVGNVAKIGRGGDHPSISIDGQHNVIVNDDSEDHDFRIETDNKANAFNVDAATDQVCIGRGANASASADLVTPFGTYGLLLESVGTTVPQNSYIDITVNSGGGGFQGMLTVSNTFKANAGARTHTMFFIAGRGTDAVATSIASDDGSSGAISFTVTFPSNGKIRITNTYAGDTAISAVFIGSQGF